MNNSRINSAVTIGRTSYVKIRSALMAIRKEIFESWAKRQLLRRGYLDLFADRPPNAFPPDYADLWFLYQKVRSRKPRKVLEFGSGCSTLIMAQALWDNANESPNHSGYLYSIDAESYWAEVTENSMPRHLRRLCNVSYSPLKEVEYKDISAFRHTTVPDMAPDFVYLDGPRLTPERQVAIDILDIEGRFAQGLYIVVDGRWENAMFLKEHLKRRYKFKHRRYFGNSVFELIE